MPKKLIQTFNEISFSNNFFLFFSENKTLEHEFQCIFFQEEKKDSLENKIKNNDKKIIILSEKTLSENIFLFFSQNIADYIHIPCSPFEILFRIKNLTEKEEIQNKLLCYEDIHYNTKENRITVKKQEIKIPQMSKRLLKIFLEFPEKTISHQEIQTKLWNDIYPESVSRNIRSSVQILKKEMKKCNCDYIQNIRGEGYRIEKICRNS